MVRIVGNVVEINVSYCSKMLILDPLSLFFIVVVLISAYLLIWNIIYEVNLRDEKTSTYLGLTLMGLASALGVYVSNNLVVLMIFWEATIAASIGMAAYFTTRDTAVGIIKMAIMTVIGTAFLMLALVFLYSGLSYVVKEPSLEMLNMDNVANLIRLVPSEGQVYIAFSLALFLTGVGIEIGLVPFYLWIPEFMTRVSAHTVSYVILTLETAGFYATLRILGMYQGLIRVLENGVRLIWALDLFALLTIFIAELTALSQVRIRRMLSYSAVADAGYVLAATSHLLLEKYAPYGYAAYETSSIAYFILFMNLATALAMAITSILEHNNIFTIDEAKGVLANMPLTGLLLTLSIFSIMGIPALAGFPSKILLIAYIVSSPAPFSFQVTLLVIAGFLICATYTLRLAYNICVEHPRFEVIFPESIKRLLPLIILVIILFIGGMYPPLFLWLFGGG